MDKNNKIILVIFIASLLLFAVFVSFRHYHINLGNVEKFNENQIKIALFFATWCGHCQKYEESGTFDKSYQEIKADPRFAGKVEFVKYNADDAESKKMINDFDVRGFPSIVSISSDGKKILEFEGDRYKHQDLVDFVEKSLAKH